MPEVTVIIPTFRRPQLLPPTLEALFAQTFNDIELLIIDNAVCEHTRDVVEQYANTAPFPVQYVPNPHGGNSGSRNLGARMAKAPLLAFTDDDVSVTPGWLQAYVQAFAAHPELAAAGGRVRPLWEQPPPPWLLEYMGDAPFFGVFALMHLHPAFTMGQDIMFFSCNMAIRREVFAWTGFHPELFGRRTLGDGESGLGDDLARAGKPTAYVPEAEVWHRIGAGRMSKAYIRRWAWHLGGCNMYRAWRGKTPTPGALLRAALDVVRQHAGDWATALRTRNDLSRAAIDAGFRASEGSCKLAYLYWILTDPLTRDVLAMTDFAPCREPAD